MIEKCEKCGHSIIVCDECGKVIEGTQCEVVLGCGGIVVHKWHTCVGKCYRRTRDTMVARLRDKEVESSIFSPRYQGTKNW